MKILFSPNCPRICAIRWFGGEKSRFFHEFATQRPCGPQCAPRGRAWPERTASLLLPGADSRPAPAAPRRRSSRRGGLYGRPDRTPTTTRAPGHRGPATAACGHAALRGSAEARRESEAVSGGYTIRPYMPALPFSIVGAHFICARAAPPVCRRLARKRSRPYAVVFTWSVGRGAHTPPNQPAGTTGLAAISKGRALCPPEPRRRTEPAPAFHIKYPAACPAAGLND